MLMEHENILHSQKLALGMVEDHWTVHLKVFFFDDNNNNRAFFIVCTFCLNPLFPSLSRESIFPRYMFIRHSRKKKSDSVFFYIYIQEVQEEHNL
jgi:hypothetical protein